MNYHGPIVLVVMDGVGISSRIAGNAVLQAHTEFLDHARQNYLNIPLAASGEAVGVLSGDIGNSEVGHITLGSGQIIKQGAARIAEAFASGEVFLSNAWKTATAQVIKNHSTLHFSGIFSDGNVHSNIEHLEKMIAEAYRLGIRKIRVHAIFDGRDVPSQSEPKYIKRIENFWKQFDDADYKIASGGGRMTTVSDRYENDWGMVERGYDIMVNGQAEFEFHSAEAAIKTFRDKDPDIQDQYLPAFVIVDEKNRPVGKIIDGDAMIYFDFRADRAVEIARTFTEPDFNNFPRSNFPDIVFVGMTEYEKDRHIPALTLVPPMEIDHTFHHLLGAHQIPELAISETIKFGHITYYFNGCSYNKAPFEDFIEISSDETNFDQRPWMKTAEITDAIIDNLEKYRFIRLNFPGGDMVGHYAKLEPAIIAMESIDIALKRIAEKVDSLGGMMIITADHGKAEELISASGAAKTAHTLNKVPCIFYDNTENRNKYQSAELENPGLANVAATIATLLNLAPDSTWLPSLIKLR